MKRISADERRVRDRSCQPDMSDGENDPKADKENRPSCMGHWILIWSHRRAPLTVRGDPKMGDP
jgi:hypothetical protein